MGARRAMQRGDGGGIMLDERCSHPRHMWIEIKV
jgi:hypothetical protein